MAARTRDSTTPLKEKRGTSPSAQAVTTQQRRRSPNPSKTSSPAQTRASTTTATEKHVPNYLRSTASSGIDVSKQQGKKPVSSTDTAATHKPDLSRRRSFDKPPSTQKSRVSPNPTLRSSSSFSGKTVGSSHHKPVVEKNLKAPAKDAAGRQHGLYARPVGAVKKSSSVQVKKQSETGGSKSAAKEQVTSPAAEKVDNLPIPEPEMPKSCTSEAEEETVAVVHNDDKGCEDLTAEDQEPVKNVEQMEDVSDDNKDAKIVTVEPPTVSEHEDTSLAAKIEDNQENEPHAEEISSEKHELKEDSAANEINNTITDESVACNPINEDVEEKHEEEEANEKEEPVASASEAHETEEKEVQQVAVVEEKHEAEESPPPKVQVVAHGKKDSAVSNDAIEETASKLREQRKNKVKALAGAFESVMQDPKR